MRSRVSGRSHGETVRWRRRRHWGTVPEDVLHLLSIVQAGQEIDIVLSGSSLPQHDTSERIRVQVHVRVNQRLDLFRGDIVSRPRSTLSSWKTNEQLCFGVHGTLDDTYPIIEIEMASVVHKVTR